MSATFALPVEETTDLIQLEHRIESSLHTTYDALAEIRDRKLYVETHATFEAYCLERWNISRQRAYQLINASEIAKDLSTPGRQIPEKILRPLSVVPNADRKEVFEEAASKSNGKPTAKAVQEAVDRKLNKPPKSPKLDQAGAIVEPKPTGQSIVNGVLQADPPLVAKMRAEGKIAANAVPEIEASEAHTTQEAIAEEREERKGKQEDDLSDADWLAKLPVHPKLIGASLKTFEEEALAYRELDGPRSTFVHHMNRVINGCRRRGPFVWAMRQFTKIDHPKRWLVCPAPDQGGCGGTGQVPLIGPCPKCREKGYRINNA